MARIVLMISSGVNPDPLRREIPGLVADLVLRGSTHLATRSNNVVIGAEMNDIAVIDEDGRLLAVGRSNSADANAPANMPGVYVNYPLAGANRWLRLTDLRAFSPSTDLDILGWTRGGVPLTTANCPHGQGRLLFHAD